jgi:hypothetical protein
MVLLVGGTFAVAVLGGGRLLDDALGLKIEVNEGRYLNGIIIANVRQSPIRILDISVNSRPDCYSFTQQNTELKMGDQTFAIARCDVIQVIVKTDRGSATYNFR